MITGSAVYHVVEAMAPLYTAAALGYASVRWFKAFTGEQCAGINHFVALYAVPVLIFHIVSTNDPYHMNERLVAADTLQKVVVLLVLVAWAVWSRLRRRGGAGGAKTKKAGSSSAPLKWVVTNFSVASLPNTVIIGVPLLDSMFGSVSGGLMKQIVVLQMCVWYNVVIFLYEFMAAREGSDKINPADAENWPVACDDDDETVPADRSGRHEVAVNIEITEVAAAPTCETNNKAESRTGGAGGVTKEGEALKVPVPVPAPSVMHVVWKAVKKLLLIPNTYASFLGLIWSLIAFKVGMKMPKIVDDSLFVIYTTAIGLSMFGSGMFIARQPRFVPCGYTIASLCMVLKFLISPVIMLVASLAVGLHGTLLHIAVVQAALPLAVNSFVYAEEYKVHADIMSTGVVLGIFVSLPVTIVYYILLGS